MSEHSDTVKFTDQQRLVHGILSSLTDALRMVVGAREHHAFCIRACGLIQTYEKDWILFHHTKWSEYSQDQKDLMKRWHEYILTSSETASAQIQRGHPDAVYRSVIYLSDILENLTESFLQTCLLYIDDRVISIKQLTGRYPRDRDNAVEIRKSVRTWERSIKLPSRLDRFCIMIETFFPTFEFPPEKRKNLDKLICFRNRLTHELIIISPTFELGEETHEQPEISDEVTQSFFDDLGDYILALMDAFRTTASEVDKK